MSKLSDNYKKKIEEDLMQFLYLANKSDVKLLVGKYERKNLREYARLACIALIYGYKQTFLKIFAIVERDTDKFIAELDSLNGNFALLESWVKDFIDGIEIEAMRNLAREHWEECKQKIDKDNFDVRQIL